MQAYELTVPLADGGISRASLGALAAAFHDKHCQTYGHANPEEPVQLATLRLTAIGRLPALKLGRPPAAASSPRQRMREVWFPEAGFVACPVYPRERLRADETLSGQAIVGADGLDHRRVAGLDRQRR